MAQIDWDLEAMGQTGRVGVDRVQAWAVGARVGYFLETPWTIRLGIQADAASGDRYPGDVELNTFNPLFPNGSYVTLAGYTSYRNLVHIKPSLNVQPAANWSLMFGLGLQWRQTSADGVYVLRDTSGQAGRWTGVYGQGRFTWAVNGNVSLAVEAVHNRIGQSVRQAGGHDSNYLGIEAGFAW